LLLILEIIENLYINIGFKFIMYRVKGNQMKRHYLQPSCDEKMRALKILSNKTLFTFSITKMGFTS